MSLLGFDAVGRRALGELGAGNISMPAVSGSFTISGVAQTFKITENVTAGSFALSAPSISEVIRVAAGTFTVTGASQVLKITENVSAGSYVITGAIANNLSGVSSPGAFNLIGVNTALIWTGAGVDTLYTGGVGHYLEELEQQKRLNAITRKIPGPVDRRTVPRFEPLRGAPSAAAAPPPAGAAIPPQPMAAAAAQAEAAKRRRRDEEAVLLLAC
jgi:hypothetical protein